MKIHPMIALLLLTVSISACVTPKKTAPKASLANVCESYKFQARPEWVSHEASVSGYRVGIGSAIAKNDLEKADAAAQDIARAEIASGIRADLSQQLVAKVAESRVGQRSQVSQEIEVLTQSQTKLTLTGAKKTAQWLEPGSCRLYVRVQLPEAEAVRLVNTEQAQLLFKQAEANYQQAAKIELSERERLQQAEQALAILKQIDFSYLPEQGDQTLLIKRYQQRVRALFSQLSARDEVVIVSFPERYAKNTQGDFYAQLSALAQFQDAWLHQQARCDSETTCLQVARGSGAKTLTWLQFSQQIEAGDMGSLLGELNLQSHQYNVETGQRIGLAKTLNSQILSFDSRDLDWSLALARLLENY